MPPGSVKESLSLAQLLGKPNLAPRPGGIIEGPLAFNAAKQPGRCTVRLTAVMEKGECIVR